MTGMIPADVVFSSKDSHAQKNPRKEAVMRYLNKGAKEQQHRLIILTDMENEPDDSQTMVHLLMYANEVDIEGLIAVGSRWLQSDVFPESIHDRVKAYGVVRPNLMKHASGWPTEEELLEKIGGGQIGYGMGAVGDGKSTTGSELIIKAIDKPDPRPVWFAINAGANTLAQALWDVRARRSPEDVAEFVSRIRVYDDSGQDDAGAWIAHEFPELFYIRSRSQIFGLFGPGFGTGPQPWKPMNQYCWIEANVRVRHGLLGALYPQRLWINAPWKPANDGTKDDTELKKPYMFMEGGGTGTWIGLVNKGLFVPEEISWGGWGGRMSWEKEQVPAGQSGVSKTEEKYHPYLMYPQAADYSYSYGDPDAPLHSFSGVDGSVNYYARDFAPMWRWREGYFNDFKARMDWCVTEYDQANHNPIAVFMGDENRAVCRLEASAGETFPLDASGSRDPDGDQLTFKWEIYPEAGTYEGDVSLQATDQPVAEVTIPNDAAGKQIHVILSVTDTSRIAPLTSYRRVVIDVI